MVGPSRTAITAQKALYAALTLLISISLGALAGELIIRLKNRSMNNYDIEMWRYSRELKVRSPDPVLDFEHKPNSQALLQSVVIRTNGSGLRGGPVPLPKPNQRRILFLGSSITLGWGVPEEETFSSRVNQALIDHGASAVVMNAGIGNYNATRYVHRFLTRLTDLAPTDIVVQAFVRDGEVLEPTDASWLLRNSELAVTLWIASHRLFDHTGEQALEDHYRSVYQTGGPGIKDLEEAFADLAKYAKEHEIRVYMVMTPDVHNLGDYKLQFVHDIFAGLASRYSFRYLDLKPFFGVLTPKDLWAMPGDPHPNSHGHAIMAEATVPMLLEAGTK